MTWLGKIPPEASRPAVWRLLQAYRSLQLATRELLAEREAQGARLAERVVLLGVVQDFEDAIVAAQRWLSRDASIRRRQAEKPEVAGRPRAPLPADPLFLGLMEQALPAGGAGDYVNTLQGVGSDG